MMGGQGKQQNSVLSRRNFLKLLAAVGVTTAGGYVLSEYTPWLNYDEQVEDICRPLERDFSVSTQMQELVRYATLAANGHNTQPWKFAIKEYSIEIHPDYDRCLSIVDPDNREFWISLGCALENLLITARGIGYAPETTYPDATDLIQVRLTADIPQPSSLFDAITLRQNTRSEYDGPPITNNELDQMQASPLEPGLTLHFVTKQKDLEAVLEYVNQGNLSQYADHAFLEELIYWLRFNQKEALASLDGLYSRCSGNPEVPRWLGQMFVAGIKPQEQADADARKFRSSSGAVIIASSSEDRSTWVRTGQVYERLALQSTALGIQSAFLNQPIEIADVRRQFQSAIGLGNAFPQLLVRLGHADTMPHFLRRPIDQVLI